MGRRKKRAPRRGSLAFLPKGRARSIVSRIRYWPDPPLEQPKLLGFAGYKAGMTHVYLVDDRPHSPTYGREFAVAATVLEAPPIHVCAVRGYEKVNGALKCVGEAWEESPPKHLERRVTLPEKFDHQKALEELKNQLDRLAEIRVLVCTQPWLSNMPKKKPELFEVKVGGGSVEDRLEYAEKILGSDVEPSEVFEEGQFIDVIAVTKGKGFAGPIKRWGVHRLQHKSRKTKRGVGAIGPWKPPHVMYTVPRPGQLGFFQRTEYNKRILKIGSDGEEVTPKGGFLRYGIVRSNYILLQGSVPGPAKRLIRLRYPARPPAVELGKPQLLYISTESQQGV